MFSESDPLAQLSLSEMSPPVEAVNPDSVGGLGDIQGRLTHRWEHNLLDMDHRPSEYNQVIRQTGD